MSEPIEAKASCLCGAVTISAKNINPKVGACHCGMCRTWGGGPWLAVDCGTEVRFKGEKHISKFDSSEWAERGFCSQCGTHLFYRLKRTRQLFMPVGLFDLEAFDFDHQIFIDKKPSYYSFSNQTKDLTEAEVFAKYAPPEE